jgi:hypothetical protein
MRTTILIVFCALGLSAQDPTQPTPSPVATAATSISGASFYATGATLDTTSHPTVNGFFGWAKPLNQSGTFSLTSYRIYRTGTHPFKFTSSVEQGIAQHVKSWKRFDAYICASGGIAAGGDNVGYSATLCGIGTARLGKHIGLMARAAGEKSSLSDGRGTYTFGFLYRR